MARRRRLQRDPRAWPSLWCEVDTARRRHDQSSWATFADCGSPLDARRIAPLPCATPPHVPRTACGGLVLSAVCEALVSIAVGSVCPRCAPPLLAAPPILCGSTAGQPGSSGSGTLTRPTRWCFWWMQRTGTASPRRRRPCRHARLLPGVRVALVAVRLPVGQRVRVCVLCGRPRLFATFDPSVLPKPPPLRAYHLPATVQSLLEAPQLARAPTLVLGTKMELPGAADAATLRAALALPGPGAGTAGARPVALYMCAALRGFGFGEGLRWLMARAG